MNRMRTGSSMGATLRGDSSGSGDEMPAVCWMRSRTTDSGERGASSGPGVGRFGRVLARGRRDSRMAEIPDPLVDEQRFVEERLDLREGQLNRGIRQRPGWIRVGLEEEAVHS